MENGIYFTTIFLPLALLVGRAAARLIFYVIDQSIHYFFSI